MIVDGGFSTRHPLSCKRASGYKPDLLTAQGIILYIAYYAAIGDLWIIAITLGYPPHAYVIDEKDGIRILLPNSEGKKK
jgi:hypothetical protein